VDDNGIRDLDVASAGDLGVDTPG